MFLSTLLSALLVVVVAVHGDEHFFVDILESGVPVRQEVTRKGDLQIIHVPAHRDFEEVELYMDFQNQLQLVKLSGDRKCQLSKMDPEVQLMSAASNKAENGPLDSSAMKHTQRVRLESNTPLANLSHLREEMQVACQDMLTFWVETVEENEYRSARNTLSTLGTAGNQYQFSPYSKGSQTCAIGGSGVVGSQIQCHPNCFFQLCNPNGGKWCYYNVVHCPMVTTSCWQHLSNIPLACVPCCSDPKVPCSGQIKYCGCHANPQIGK